MKTEALSSFLIKKFYEKFLLFDKSFLAEAVRVSVQDGPALSG